MFGKILKYTVIGAIFLSIGLLLFRIVLLNRYPAVAEGIFDVPALGDPSEIHAVTWEVPVPYDNSGFSNFFSHQPIYVEDGGILYITIRYNRSLEETVGGDFGYAGEIRDVPLTVTLHTDEAIFSPSTIEVSEAYGLYYYRRYAFEGVTINGISYLELQVRYGTGTPLSEEAFATLSLLLDGMPTKPYKLTKTDLSRIH